MIYCLLRNHTWTLATNISTTLWGSSTWWALRNLNLSKRWHSGYVVMHPRRLLTSQSALVIIFPIQNVIFWCSTTERIASCYNWASPYLIFISEEARLLFIYFLVLMYLVKQLPFVICVDHFFLKVLFENQLDFGTKKVIETIAILVEWWFP